MPVKQNAAIENSSNRFPASGQAVVQLDYTRPADEQIAIAVKTAVLSMELPPGQLISEKEIGRMFGASRTPVRAAFAQLREEGLLVTWPSRGTFVTNLSLKEIRAALFLRESIETTVVEYLCRTGLPKNFFEAISQNLSEQQSAAVSGEDAKFRMLDDQFHLLLGRATGFDRVVTALKREKAVLDRLRSLTFTNDVTMDRLRMDHIAIFEAIKAKSKETAIESLQAHVRLASDTLSDLVEKHRGYFDLDETLEEQ